MAGLLIGIPQIADNAVTLAKMAGGTDGQIITYDASGDPVAVGPGSDGEVLTSTGAGSPPAFEAAGGGKILQVLSTPKTDTASTTSTTFEACSGLTVNITPAATSKVLVIADVNIGNSHADYFTHVRLTRLVAGGSIAPIYIADAAGDRARASSLDRNDNNQNIANKGPKYLDTHGADGSTIVTYSVQWRVEGQTGYLNRTSADTDNTSYGRTASSITVMEVGA